MARFLCPDCGRAFAYPISSCTWCGVALTTSPHLDGIVEAVTQVSVPSVGHEDVPYWCALVRGEDGSATIVERDHAVAVGDAMSLGHTASIELATVGVVGTGVMGCSLVELLVSRGHRVRWHGRSVQRMARSVDKVMLRLGRVMNEDELADAAARLQSSNAYDVLADCDVVIEAVVEELAPKQVVLAAAESVMAPNAVLATNTSGLSLDDLATALSRPERFGALHFFNPATRMRLVETAVCGRTSPDVAEHLDRFARSLGKVPVRVAATPAFAVNRALMPLLNEAVRELEEGVASASAIDDAIRLGLNHPMGPLALIDLIGVDVVVDIMENLAVRTGDETYAPRPMLLEMVGRAALGRKTGHGFYEYPG